MERQTVVSDNTKRIRLRFPAIAAIALVVIVIVIVILIETGALTSNNPLADKLPEYGVIIDAGHGGSDPGAISTVTGTHEDGLNLAVTKALETDFLANGIPVVLTRTDSEALGATKEDDMLYRKNTIQGGDSAIMISIHMNSFPDNADVWGPQVFYQEGSRTGKALAQAIQNRLNELTGGTRREMEDKLYVLGGNQMPSVLVECGFLSNPNEAESLEDSEYQKQIAEAIRKGVFDYCGLS